MVGLRLTAVRVPLHSEMSVLFRFQPVSAAGEVPAKPEFAKAFGSSRRLLFFQLIELVHCKPHCCLIPKCLIFEELRLVSRMFGPDQSLSH